MGAAVCPYAGQRWETRPPFRGEGEWGGRVSLADGGSGGTKAVGWPRGCARGKSARRSVLDRSFASHGSRAWGTPYQPCARRAVLEV